MYMMICAAISYRLYRRQEKDKAPRPHGRESAQEEHSRFCVRHRVMRLWRGAIMSCRRTLRPALCHRLIGELEEAQKRSLVDGLLNSVELPTEDWKR